MPRLVIELTDPANARLAKVRATDEVIVTPSMASRSSRSWQTTRRGEPCTSLSMPRTVRPSTWFRPIDST